MWREKTAQGFTLIELMIMVAIIGILAAIAIPQLAMLVCHVQNRDRIRKGLAPKPCEEVTTVAPSMSGCSGKPVSLSVDRYGGKHVLYDTGCIEDK